MLIREHLNAERHKVKNLSPVCKEMSAHVLLNLLNELRKRDKKLVSQAFYLFFATSLINSIIRDHKY